MADELDTTENAPEAGGAADTPETPSVPGASSVPAAASNDDITDAHANETEYERTQRLKLNTDDAPHSGAIDQDIAKILEEVKLPERRQSATTAKVTPRPQASIGTMVMPKEGEPAKPIAPPEPKERDIVTPLHTLKDDVQDVVREHQITMVRASALEEDKKRDAPKRVHITPGTVARRRRTLNYLFSIILLVVLGVGAFYGVALVTAKRSQTAAQQYPSLIFAEQTETLPIDSASPGELKETIAQARTQDQAPLGSITRIVPTITTTNAAGLTANAPATTQQFLTALGVQAPQSLLRALGSNFFFGIHTVDINAPVLVIPVTDYDAAFAGMLAWEPMMDQDLAPAFDAVPVLTTDSNGLPVARTFSDTVMLNYDVRVLKDDAGNVVLYYSFPTPSVLVIAESPYTFTEILSRLQAQGDL